MTWLLILLVVLLVLAALGGGGYVYRSYYGPGPVGPAGGMVEERIDEERLARLEVRPDPDDQVGIGGKLRQRHGQENRELDIKCRAARRSSRCLLPPAS